MQSLLQEALRSGAETPDSLLTSYGVSSKRHPVYPNLVQFKYHQFESPLQLPLVREARGIILDEADNWRVIAWPFEKFFNHGEQLAATIYWPGARVQEKVDGSLIILYHYAGKWHAATSGMPDAGGQVNGFAMTFADLFWQTIGPAFFDGIKEPWLEDTTFLFELSAPENRVVVRNTERKVTLLGARMRLDGTWATGCQEFARRYGLTHVREFPLTSLDAALATFETMDPLQQEGYVIVDSSWNRIKVKHPGYVAIHGMRGEGALSPKRVLNLIREGETTEILAHFPEWKPAFDKIQGYYSDFIREVERDFRQLRDLPTQKDFALEAVKTRCSAALFQLRSGRVSSVAEYLAGAQIDSVAELLRLKEVTL